jgi:hypothetical protein
MASPATGAALVARDGAIGRCLQPCSIAREDRDVAATCGEFARGDAADSCAGSCDDEDHDASTAAT